MERDEYKCQWCLVVHERIRIGNHVHHLFRPHSMFDEIVYMVTLCEECHMQHVHSDGRIKAQDIIEKVMIPYVWGGSDLTPIGKGK